MSLPDTSAIVGDDWIAEAASGGYRLLVFGDNPDTLDCAVKYLLHPTFRLAYWELEFQGYSSDAEVWLLSPRLGSTCI